MSDNFKKLTGKNRNEYETVAKHLVDDCDVELFKELVDNDDFLFDFVKNNVTQRISNAINETNYQNLLEFLKYYSQSYEDTIVSALVKYADEDLTDIMLDKFENVLKSFEVGRFAKISLNSSVLARNSSSVNFSNCGSKALIWSIIPIILLTFFSFGSPNNFNKKLSIIKNSSPSGNSMFL